MTISIAVLLSWPEHARIKLKALGSVWHGRQVVPGSVIGICSWE